MKIKNNDLILMFRVERKKQKSKMKLYKYDIIAKKNV